MKLPLRPVNETARLESLRRYELLDTPPDQALDDLTALAASICGTPIALISLVDEDRQWFKSRVGLKIEETPRAVSFCTHTLREPDLLIVPDAALDERFAENPLVTGVPAFRFYAGARLLTHDRHAIGTLGVIDRVPRQLSEDQQQSLRVLSRAVMAHLDVQRQKRTVAARERLLQAIVDSEPECVKLLGPDGSLRMMNGAGLAMIEADHFAQVANQSLYPLVVPEHRAEFQALTKRVFRGESGILAFQIVGLKGGTRWLETHATPFRDEHGKVTALLGVTRDITERKQAEGVLQERTMQLQTALATAHMGVWYWNLQSDEVVSIQPAGPVSGLPERHTPKTGRAFVELLHPEDRDTVVAAMERAKVSGEYETEFRILLPDGTIRWVSARGLCTRDAAGAPLTMTGVDLDITTRRQAEESLKHLNRVYSVLSDINQTIVRESDPEAMLSAACHIAVTRGGFRMAWIGLLDPSSGDLTIRAHSGASPEMLDILRTMIAADPPGGCAFTHHALDAGQHGICNEVAHNLLAAPWRAAALERGYQAMASFPLLEGKRVIGTFNLYAGEAGFFDAEEVRLLDGLAMDIAFALDIHGRELKRQRTEQELRGSEERFREVVENIGEVFWVTDPEKQRMLYISPAYETVWGRSCDSLYASSDTWRESIHPDDRTRVVQSAETRQVRGEYDEVYRIVRPDGSTRWIRDRAFPVRNAGGTVHRIVGTAIDITERTQLEEQLRQSQKMEAIGRLAGGVAHDFNNILAAIIMQAELAGEENNLPAETSEFLRDIKSSAVRAANLTSQLLAFSRRQVMQPRDLDLNEIVTSLTKMLQRILGANVRLQLTLHPRPLHLRADPGMLDQVLLNLVVNASDAMPDGGTLSIETSQRTLTENEARRIPDSTPGPNACLRVSDTGSGIPAEHLPHIFEPFFTTKDAGKGTGLGLATVFGIVKQHGGVLRVESEVDRGTTFHVLLPIVAAGAPLAPEQVVVPQTRGGTETILVVEDEPSVRALTRVVLERRGYRVLEAPNGVDALQVWDQHDGPIHLLLTDLVMPEGISGRDLAERLLKRSPELCVIFTSGYSADVAGRELSLQPGQNFIQKPSSPHSLLETVRRSLDGMKGS